MIPNAFSAYKRQSVTTMTPTEVIVRIYDELEKQLALAVHFTDSKGFEQASLHYIKAQQCINVLRESLDMKIEMSKSLDSLYEFIYHATVQANIKKDSSQVKDSVDIVAELKQAFVQVNTMSKAEISSQSNNGLKRA